MARVTSRAVVASPKPRVVSWEEVGAGAVLDQLTPLPTIAWDFASLTTCREVAARYVGMARSDIPNHVFDIPKWAFLQHLAETGQFVFHGSKKSDLSELLPHVANDNLAGTNRPRVYASSSPQMAMFSAVLDRLLPRPPGGPGISSVFNVPIGGDTGGWRHRAHIAVDFRVLPKAPWSPGTIYVLRRHCFVPDHLGVRWFCERPVRPLARIQIMPHEWPLLDQVRGVDLAAAITRFNDTAKGFPWWGDPAIYPGRTDRPYVRQARAVLDQRFAEKIPLAELAEYTGVSPSYLQRTFLVATGLSPHDYQVYLRVSRARSLLCAGRSLAGVADEVGFGDQSHLTKQFQRVLGISPGRFLLDRKNRQDATAGGRNNRDV